jgi:hypothetical protein
MNTKAAMTDHLQQEYDTQCPTCCRLAEALSESLRESRRHPLLSPEYSGALRQICAVLLQVERHKLDHGRQPARTA